MHSRSCKLIYGDRRSIVAWGLDEGTQSGTREFGANEHVPHLSVGDEFRYAETLNRCSTLYVSLYFNKEKKR